MAFTRQQIIALQNDLDATMKAFAAKHNLSVSGSIIKFSPEQFTATVMFGDKESTGEADPRYRADLLRNGWIHGLNEEHIGKTIPVRGGTGVFMGMRASKAVIKHPDGKAYKYDAAQVALMLGAERKVGGLTMVEAPSKR